MTGPPWDVCHQALVPLAPSPVPHAISGSQSRHQGYWLLLITSCRWWGRAKKLPGLYWLLEAQ